MITLTGTSVVTVRNDYKIARDSKMTEIITRKEKKKTTNLFLINESYNVGWYQYHMDIWMDDKHGALIDILVIEWYCFIDTMWHGYYLNWCIALYYEDDVHYTWYR